MLRRGRPVGGFDRLEAPCRTRVLLAPRRLHSVFRPRVACDTSTTLITTDGRVPRSILVASATSSRSALEATLVAEAAARISLREVSRLVKAGVDDLVRCGLLMPQDSRCTLHRVSDAARRRLHVGRAETAIYSIDASNERSLGRGTCWALITRSENRSQRLIAQ